MISGSQPHHWSKLPKKFLHQYWFPSHFCPSRIKSILPELHRSCWFLFSFSLFCHLVKIVGVRVRLDLGCRSGRGLVAAPGGEGRSVRRRWGRRRRGKVKPGREPKEETAGGWRRENWEEEENLRRRGGKGDVAWESDLLVAGKSTPQFLLFPLLPHIIYSYKYSQHCELKNVHVFAQF